MPTKGAYTDADLVQTDPTAALAGSAGDIPTERPSMANTLAQGVADFGKGVVKGGLNTVRGLGNIETKVPFLKSLMPADVQSYLGPEGEKMNATHGTMQALGKGAEQAGEFMIPGGAEEKLAGMAPKVIRPLARIGASALGSGAVNAAQGGNFGTGAAMGAAGSALGQGLKAAAPAVAEKALGIRGKFDRAFNKTPGLAALEETSGIRPETIANQAKERIGQLAGQTEELANKASERPNPVRGMLPPPKQEIPLAPTPSPRNPRMRPMSFPAKVNPEEPMEPRSGNPLAPISEYPGVNPHYLSGSAHPELSGRIPTTQGVLIRPGEVSHEPLPATVPNRMASLAPARNVIGQAQNTAIEQNAAGTHGQLQPMADFLGKRFNTGEPIPENVTPRELLNLRRGFNEEHGQWNPERHEQTTNAARQAYGGLTGEFHRVLPEAEPLDRRVSNLIPVKNRAQIQAISDPTVGRILERVARPTGALAGTLAGGAAGYHERGVPGMIGGGILGGVAPVLATSPEAEMALARSLYRASALRPLQGIGAQFTQRKEDQGQ